MKKMMNEDEKEEEDDEEDENEKPAENRFLPFVPTTVNNDFLQVSSKSLLTQNSRHHLSFLLLQDTDFLLNRVFHQQAIGNDLALLANSMRPVNRLGFHSRVPPRVAKHHIRSRRQIQTAATGFQ